MKLTALRLAARVLVVIFYGTLHCKWKKIAFRIIWELHFIGFLRNGRLVYFIRLNINILKQNIFLLAVIHIGNIKRHGSGVDYIAVSENNVFNFVRLCINAHLKTLAPIIPYYTVFSEKIVRYIICLPVMLSLIGIFFAKAFYAYAVVKCTYKAVVYVNIYTAVRVYAIAVITPAAYYFYI